MQADNDGIELVPVTDPNEHAFTIHLPRGWQNQAYLVRIQGVHRAVVNSRNADGSVFLFLGDPHMPGFMEPTPDMYMGHPMVNLNPMMQVQPFTHAEPFFFHYIQQRYGHAPGFRVTHGAPCPELERMAHTEAQKHGIPIQATSIRFSFEYTDGDKPMRARLYGLTLSIGSVWIAEVSGVLTTADQDPDHYDALMFRIGRSRVSNPQWQQQQNHMHAQQMQQNHLHHQNTMAQMQRNHQNNMQWIQNSAQQRQIRMDGIHAQGDAQMDAWRAQQTANDEMHRNFMNAINEQTTIGYNSEVGNAGDASHQRFLNYVKDENTVVRENGNTYQVDGSHERYYKHKYNDTYVGTDNYTERDDLRSHFGINPDDYEEVKVQR